MSNQLSYLQFGEFSIDRASRQLRRGSSLIPLQSKAFDLLLFMAQNQGRLLTKDELLASVWPDSIVEESNLSQNVFLLRKAFGAEGQSLIVTVPGRGYQFTGQVSENVPTLAADHTSASIEAIQTRLVLIDETEEHIAAWRSRSVQVISAICLALFALAAWFGWQHWQDEVGGAPVQIVLTDLDSSSGDAVLDRSLVDAMRIELAQSPFVSVVSQSLARKTLVQMRRNPEDHLTVEVARDLCERTSSQAVLHGTMARTGTHYLLTFQATNCVDGSIVATAKAEATSADGLPGAIDSLAATLRRRLGESRRTISRFSQPLFAMNTASIEALKAYSQALRFSQQGKMDQAIDLLKQSVAADPGFAPAWLDLSTYSANLGDAENDRKYLIKAYELRMTATAITRYYTEARYHTTIEGDLYQGKRDFETMSTIYPRNLVALAGLLQINIDLGLHGDAVAIGKRALAQNSSYISIYYGVADEQLKSNQPADALATCRLAIARGLDGDLIRGPMLKIAALTGDTALRTEVEQWSDAHNDADYTLMLRMNQALTEGRIVTARQLLNRVTQSLHARGLDTLAAAYRRQSALGFELMGDKIFATELLHSSAFDPKNKDEVDALDALGQTQEAEGDLNKALESYPHSTLWTGLIAPLFKARALLRQNHPADAVAALEPARQFDAVGYEVAFTRAQAYLANHQPALAEAEFKRILQNRQLGPISQLLPLARIGLAQSLTAQGKATEATETINQLLIFWSHADPQVRGMAKTKLI